MKKKTEYKIFKMIYNELFLYHISNFRRVLLVSYILNVINQIMMKILMNWDDFKDYAVFFLSMYCLVHKSCIF